MCITKIRGTKTYKRNVTIYKVVQIIGKTEYSGIFVESFREPLSKTGDIKACNSHYLLHLSGKEICGFVGFRSMKDLNLWIGHNIPTSFISNPSLQIHSYIVPKGTEVLLVTEEQEYPAIVTPIMRNPRMKEVK